GPRSDRPGPDRAPAGRTGRGAPRVTAAPADGSDKPAEAGAAPEAPKPAVKRVRKAPTPAAGGAKGE
ncbi:MAG: 30S ribosomal protein S3, partial [Aquincola sp.]|nr:30S ribosomal protein S3 [Aquincola sp.]